MGTKIFNVLLLFSRIFVGSLFIVSGMIKANDPTGFSYKMEEYFSEDALNWTFFEPYALFIAALICIAEIVLGFAVLFGGKAKLTSWLLMAMILFFLALTFYTATCDPQSTYKAMVGGVEIDKQVQCVTDCGCFGDALKGTIGRSLTPWESFTKDVILFFFVLPILIGSYIFSPKRLQKKSNELDTSDTAVPGYRFALNTPKQDSIILVGSTVFILLFAGYFFQWMFPVYFSVVCFGIYVLLKKRHVKFMGPDWTIAIVMTLISTAFAVYTTSYLPVKDFTAYAVGNDIKEKMNDGVAGVFETKVVYLNKQTGKKKTFQLTDPEWQDTTIWKWDTTLNEEVKKGRIASISSFNPEGDYEMLTAAEKNHPALKQIIDQQINSYYQRLMAINSVAYGTDSIDPIDYNQETYPDSAFKVLGISEKLLNKDKHFMIDHKNYLTELPNVILFTMLHAETAYTGSMDDIKTIIANATKAGVPVYILTASGKPETDKLEKQFKLNARYLTMDETELKIVVRANPGLIMLKKGVVTGKWPGRGLPDWGDIKEKL
ncbi:MAG: DoxX family protein [Flavobacteriales bacterium]